jgi:signal transduction histidine kinase
VKFTPRGGRITVSAWMGSTAFGPAGLTLAIADTGIGIRQEDLPIVLEAFGQARAEKGALTTARHEGAGLGLSIVRGLLGAHGATFELQSEFGKGTTVLAHLPSTCISERVPAELKSAIGM